MDELKIGGIIVGFVTLVLLLVACNPIAIVHTGERGIKTVMGKVQPESYTEGVHFVMPFVSDMKIMDIKTQKSNIVTQTYTKDLQQARITYVVNYNLQANNSHKMFGEVGKNYKDVVLVPVVEGTVKDVIGSFNANDLVGNRNIVTNNILAKLQDQLSNNYIDITDFQITDINYNDTFEKAVELKVQAEQEALKAKNTTIKITEEAKQKVISAEAEAKSMAIRANALAQNKALVEYEAVQKWSGNVPQVVCGKEMIPFINLNNLK